MKFDAILFDLDGTLWDSTQVVRQSWIEAAEAWRPGLGAFITPDAIRRNMGRVLPVIFADIFPQLSQAEQLELMALCGKRELELVSTQGGILMPELEPTLAQLSRERSLFIVSNCQDGYIPAFYQAHGLDRYFTDFEYAGRTGKTKGENIALVAERYHLKHPIYVGDTQGDSDAADFAGVPFIHAAYGFGTVDHPVVRAEAVSQLPRLLLSLEQDT